MSGRTHPLWHSLRIALAAIALAGRLVPAFADTGSIHGRLEFQDAGLFTRGDSIDAAIRAENRNDAAGNLRLTWEPAWDRWTFSLHYLVAGEYGPSVSLARSEARLLPTPPPTWFNLTDTFENRGQATAFQSIDRLAIGYAAPDFVIRIGRQALTWGSGLIFRPMDLFDPFSPTATDTEYKPGTDMAYTQFLFDDGSDLQVIAVPRPARKGAMPTSDASSFAIHYHATVLGHQTTLLLARDHGDWVGGVGVNGALGGATWNLELVPTFLDDGPARISALANISDAVTLFDRNTTVFAEYFHNGFGASGGPHNLASLPRDLVDRLGRGQVFNSRQDYLATGMTVEVTPLLSVGPTLIAGLNDASAYTLASATYSLSDNLTVVAGAQVPIGPSNTEFGGMPLTAGGTTFLSVPAQIYVQVRQYF